MPEHDLISKTALILIINDQGFTGTGLIMCADSVRMVNATKEDSKRGKEGEKKMTHRRRINA